MTQLGQLREFVEKKMRMSHRPINEPTSVHTTGRSVHTLVNQTSAWISGGRGEQFAERPAACLAKRVAVRFDG